MMIEEETRGEETHGHNKSEMGYGQRRRICAWWLWVSACLQAASLKPWATQGGPLIDKRVGSQGPERGSRHPTHLIGLYFGLGAKRPPKGLRHHTHNAPRPVVAMGQSGAPIITWGSSAVHVGTRFQTMRITYFDQWINMRHFNRSISM
jgi:hypothetical protein